MTFLVIIPTYNEIENIQELIPDILNLTDNVNILVVDDNSPDGTGEKVKEIRENNSRVHLLERPGKMGLGRAYIAGFKWALKEKFDVIFEMDADFSHKPSDLKRLMNTIQARSDFVVGSRYVPGGATENWGFLRKLISLGGSFYARIILGYPLRDWTGGFNGWRKEVLEQMPLDEIQSEGYSFQIELKFRALKMGFKGEEVPIVFEDRRVGQSKMSAKIVFEAFYRVLTIRMRA